MHLFHLVLIGAGAPRVILRRYFGGVAIIVGFLLDVIAAMVFLVPGVENISVMTFNFGMVVLGVLITLLAQRGMRKPSISPGMMGV